MNKKLLAATAFAIILGCSSVYADQYSAFTDVPKGHWAYKAIDELAEKGVLLGYSDGSFRGENTISRNTMAMLVAQMLANIEQFVKEERSFGITKKDIKLLTDLAYEFKDEMVMLGTKVGNLAKDIETIKKETFDIKSDIATIKKAATLNDNVKVGGEFLVDFVNRHKSVNHGNNRNYTTAEINLTFDAKIDENVSAYVYWTMYDDKYGTTLGGSSNINDEIYMAYIDIDDLAKGKARIGRDFYTHGHAFVIHDYIDALQYKFKSGVIDVGLNAFYTRHPFSVAGIVDDNNHKIWNFSLDFHKNSHDLYLAYYAQTYKDNTDESAPVNGDFKNAKRQIVEVGATGSISSKAGIGYDVGLVYSKTECDVYGTDGWESTKDDGLLQHYALTWKKPKNNLSVKVAYTTANEEYDGTISLYHKNSEYDSDETPIDDIARIMNDFNDNMANTEDLKFQLEYVPSSTKHSLRLAYDILKENKDNVKTDLIGTSGTCNIAGYDKLDTNIMTLEYRYRITENTRLKIGYTAADNSSSKNYLGQQVKDETMLWTEIYSKF